MKLLKLIKRYLEHSYSTQGFTLVELLLYSSVLSIIILSIAILLSLVTSSRVKNEIIAEVEQQGVLVTQTVTQTIRNATTITSPGVGATAVTLILTVPLAAKSPTNFDLNAGAIRIVEDTDGTPATNSLTSSRLTASGLQFQNLSRLGTDGTIKFQFTLTYINPSGRNDYNYVKTFYGSASLR